MELRFIDDSGAEKMLIYYDDIRVMMGADAEDSNVPENHLMGYSGSVLADGSISVCRVFAIEVNMNGVDKHGNTVQMLDNWTTIPCETSEPGQSDADNGVERLNGAWL